MSGKHTTVHKSLIAEAKRQGWRTGNWKREAMAVLQHPSLRWLLTDGESRESMRWQFGEVIQAIRDIDRLPDAYRFRLEGPDTPGKDWLRLVLVIEFLEVTATSPISDDKYGQYDLAWFRIDPTDIAHFRVYECDRFGTETVCVDEFMPWSYRETYRLNTGFYTQRIEEPELLDA